MLCSIETSLSVSSQLDTAQIQVSKLGNEGKAPDQRTVFVVGAGASHEFGLPVGKKLQENISSLTRMNVKGSSYLPFTANSGFYHNLSRAVGLTAYTTNDQHRLAQKAHRISESVKFAASIDNYLHAQRADAETVAIGKLAISYCILAAEHASSLSYPDGGQGFANRSGKKLEVTPDTSWIGQLVKLLSAGRDFSDFCKKLQSLTFVCFNYDRCIERYFSEVASLIYPDADFNQQSLNQSLNIIHPYGYLGDLLPEKGRHGTFGNTRDDAFVISAAKGIKTFTEGMDSNVRNHIGEAFSSASRVLFLGYGFIPVNDEFLFGSSPFENRVVLGTCLGISEEKTESIIHKVGEACMTIKTPFDGRQRRGKPQFRREGCADLIHRFSHELELI